MPGLRQLYGRIQSLGCGLETSTWLAGSNNLDYIRESRRRKIESVNQRAAISSVMTCAIGVCSCDW